MRPHDRLDDEARDQAALYSLGSMSAPEAAAYGGHLSACAVCRNEVSSLRASFAALAALTPPVPPPVALKERLLQRIRAEGAGEPAVQIWKQWSPDRAEAGLTLLPKSVETWEPTGVDGVEVRRLFVDEAQDRATMLVRMKPGSSYPTHRHGGSEECYVIEGDLLVGEYRMRAGDYQRASGGSVHGVQSTEGGCVLLIISSLHDELLEGRT